MQLDAQTFLRLAEKQHTLVFFDIEATSVRGGDYGTVHCVSAKPYGKKPETWANDKPGDDRATVAAAASYLAGKDCWVTYYGKGYDVKMMNARLLRHGLPMLEKVHHIDMYYSLKSRLLMSRRSQAHYMDWLELPERKMSVSADTWASAPVDWEKSKSILVKRCESDVRGLETLYKRTKDLILDIRR